MSRTYSSSTVLKFQAVVKSHFELITVLCTFQKTDFERLNSISVSRAVRQELKKKEKEVRITLKLVDKPNLHRKPELVHTTLPMVKNVSNVADLIFEKIIKR